jgi:hypothetical protein
MMRCTITIALCLQSVLFPVSFHPMRSNLQVRNDDWKEPSGLLLKDRIARRPGNIAAAATLLQFMCARYDIMPKYVHVLYPFNDRGDIYATSKEIDSYQAKLAAADRVNELRYVIFDLVSIRQLQSCPMQGQRILRDSNKTANHGEVSRL